MSQPRPCSMSMQLCSHCSHAVDLAIEISQSSQPTQPLQQWRCLSHAHASCACSHAAIAAMQSCSHGDFSAFAAYTPTAAMEISQPRSCFMRMQPCSQCSHAVTHAREISQPSQPMPPLQQWRCLSHIHTHAHAHAHAHCSHIVIAAI